MMGLTRRQRLILATAVTLFAFGLRAVRLDEVPPGWRDDELINSLVISQKVLDGEWAFYFADASGHEALYHTLNAGLLGLFGANALGIRLLSVLLGTLTIPLTYALGRRLFNVSIGLTGAAALAVSFWSLMYSRIGLRHIALPFFLLLTFLLFWEGVRRMGDGRRAMSLFAAAGAALGVGFYTYFASRGVPLILIALGGYWWLVDRATWRRTWRGLLLTLGVAALVGMPLAVTLGQQPAAEARVSELAVPLTALREGNWAPLREHVETTLSMFHASGDPEWLYNIPGRPVFSVAGALFFWGGVATAVVLVGGRKRGAGAAALLLLWWGIGIAPAFVSVPPASLSHTIIAQPAVFLLAALPLRWVRLRDARSERALVATAMALVVIVAINSLPDYFVEWPGRGNTRFLYHADMADVADRVAQGEELRDFAISGLLAGPWARVALELELAERGVEGARPRWYQPERAIFLSPDVTFGGYPAVPVAFAERLTAIAGGEAGGYTLATVAGAPVADGVCFQNGLCLETTVYDATTQRLTLGWRVDTPLQMPPQPLISNPPPPGVYAGPRLHVFAQLWSAEGEMVAGADGLWVDPQTLRAGDRWLQQHWFDVGEGVPATVIFGLYDPLTGERIMTTDGRDAISVALEE